MVKDLVKNLCVSLETDIGGVSGATSRKVVVATPVITLTGNSVTITCATTGATIYYTLDGSTPTTSSTQYTSAIALTQSCTIKAIAVKSGMTNSGVAEESYVKPIIYLTAWQLVGNSSVHTDSYLTQWKVEGNSVVDNNAILSCGDLGQDGKYHVKISNGVDIYDIPLTEPLRKVNDVADTIEFVNGVATLTRNLGVYNISDLTITVGTDISSDVKAGLFVIDVPNRKYYSESSVLTAIYTQVAPVNSIYIAEVNLNDKECCYYYREPAYYPQRLFVYDTDYIGADAATIKQGLQGQILIYELETPITEVIQVSPFPISPTDTYTSANDTPYSAFEYKKNVEIWSCGEYSAVDGKYHILVQPLGGSIADIALTEPLRKVNDVADSIEFVNGVATLTRRLYYNKMSNMSWSNLLRQSQGKYVYVCRNLINVIETGNDGSVTNILCNIYDATTPVLAFTCAEEGVCINSGAVLIVYDEDYSGENDYQDFLVHIQDAEFICNLATPTTETIQVPQIEEADSYSCVISQGGKAVSWSSFETE